MTYEEFLIDFRAFCVEYQKWVNDGAKNGNPFRCDFGLCDNYAAYRETVYYAVDFSEQRDYLMWMFGKDFPFGEKDYADRELNCTMHKCPKRLAFVKRMIENER